MEQNETIVKTPQQKALDQAGVTAEAVEKLRATAKTVKITGPDDKVGYAAVDRARIDCKNLRTTATRVCKAGREEAQRTVKAWQNAEKEAIAPIAEIEKLHYDAQEWYHNENARIEREATEAKRKRTEERIAAFVAVNATISLHDAETLTDEEYAERYAEAENEFEIEQQRREDEERQRRFDAEATERAGRRVAEMAAIGGQIAFEDAKRLDAEQYQSVLQIAKEAKARRDAEELERQRKADEEAAEIKRQREENERKRLELEQQQTEIERREREKQEREQQASEDVTENAKEPATATMPPMDENSHLPDEYRRRLEFGPQSADDVPEATALRAAIQQDDDAMHERIEKDKEALREYVNAACGVDRNTMAAMATTKAADVATSVKAALLQWANWSMQKIDELG